MELEQALALFRGHLQTLSLEPALVDLWAYGLHVADGVTLPAGFAVGNGGQDVRHFLFPWDFDVLSREIVLNADNGPASLRQWPILAQAINTLRDLENAQSKRTGPELIWQQMHQTFHRQFLWQTEFGMAPMVRALKIYGSASMSPLIQSVYGMDLRQYLTLGAAVRGWFRREPRSVTSHNYDFLGIERRASAAFFARLTTSSAAMRTSLTRTSRADQVIYLANPLENAPLLSIDPVHPDRVYCPVPRFLDRRVTTGIFYDVFDRPGFSDAFGSAFENYVGEVLTATCPRPPFTITAEAEYKVGKDIHHGVDWILSDATGHLFIECKAKRLRQASKLLADPAILDADLDVMAEAVAQHFRNLHETLAGITQWVDDGLAIFPIILTLDDWYLIAPPYQETLRAKVDFRLDRLSVPSSMPERMPYTIASVAEFEKAIQVIAQLGIATVMKLKSTQEHQGAALLPFIQINFSAALRKSNSRLFENEFFSLTPADPRSSKVGDPPVSE